MLFAMIQLPRTVEFDGGAREGQKASPFPNCEIYFANATPENVLLKNVWHTRSWRRQCCALHTYDLAV